eukprot:8430984-Pyramimonas_sp.AAC.1
MLTSGRSIRFGAGVLTTRCGPMLAQRCCASCRGRPDPIPTPCWCSPIRRAQSDSIRVPDSALMELDFLPPFLLLALL